MRVENTVSIFAGEKTAGQRSESASGRKPNQENGGTVFAGGLNMNQDNIALKRQQAQKQALKVVTETWSGDQAIDDDIKSRKERIDALTKESVESKKVIAEMGERKTALKEYYGITDDSQEQKDLELLQKRKEMSLKGGFSLTEEEQKRLEEIDQQGTTEYQKRVLELDDQISVHEDILEEYNKQIMEENAIIAGVKLERLKSDPMVGAAKEAEAIEEAASKEIIGMLVEDAKEHIDEEQKKEEEKAEKIEEKKEKEEELLEKNKEKKEEEETGEIPTQELLSQEKTGETIKQEIQNIVNKMNLVTEDIKGSMVDRTV